MTIIVNDANILIDVIKLNLLPNFFALKYDFQTTDLVLFELHPKQQEELALYIESGIFRVVDLSQDEMIDISKILLAERSLSPQDCSAFYKAKVLNAILITSDNQLRKYSKRHKIDVHGHLWIFDKMFENKTITGKLASEKLDELNNSINPNLGLPSDECIKRKMKWNNL